MQSIVNGFKEEYGEQVAFIDLNAQDGADGERIFDQLGLRGHPSVILYSAGGQQTYQGIGILEEQQLRQEIIQTLNNG